MDQGSDAWHEWRKGRLTATDAAILLGLNQYVTTFKGWQRKIGQAEGQVVTPAMLRGQRDEPIARLMFYDESGISMTPCCIESEIHLFLGASLDGISDCGRYLLEIKSQDIERIKANGIPAYHMCQMQHQLLCTDGTATMCFYVSIWGDEIHIMEVYPDLEWMNNYIPEAKAFWKKVIFFEAPALSKGDYKDMQENSMWHSFAEEYKNICSQIKSLEGYRETMKKQLVSLCENENGCGSGIKVMKKFSKGRVDYADLVESLQVDKGLVESFRGPVSESWTIMLEK